MRTISIIDAHAEGKPLCVIIGGLPPMPGKMILEKRRYFRCQPDAVRTGRHSGSTRPREG